MGIAITQADALNPDVVLMDLLMPNVDGLTAIAAIHRRTRDDIVAVTSFIEEDKVTAALEAGASGYLFKDAAADEVARAIRAARAGEVHLDPQVARVLAQRMRARKDEPLAEPLTPREIEVLQLVASGAANKEIAAQLSITERTARTHVSNILGKLGLASRTQAALWAVDHNMMGVALTTTDHDAQLLQEAVGEAARLLESDGAMIYLFDEASGELRFAYDAGIASEEALQMLRDLRLPLGRGMYGSALARGQLLHTDDYAADKQFAHHPVADRIVVAANMRSMAAAPMFADQKPLGVLGIFSSEPRAFDEQQLTLLRALADHAATAIDNGHLLKQLRESEQQLREQASELTRALVAHRALDEIARRIVDVPDAAEVLQEVVDAASGLLDSDGAHLTVINDDRTSLRPMVAARQTDQSTRAWLRTQRFPVGGGINGLAASKAQPVWTSDYRADPRWPHDPDDDSPDRLRTWRSHRRAADGTRRRRDRHARHHLPRTAADRSARRDADGGARPPGVDRRAQRPALCRAARPHRASWPHQSGAIATWSTTRPTSSTP